METINQTKQTESINVTSILNSNTTEYLPQSTENVEIEDPNSIKQNIKENHHSQYKMTTQDNETETTNIQLPLVDRVDDNGDNNEELVDVSSNNDDADECKNNDNDAQQVESSVETQSQNMDGRESNNITDDDEDDETMANEAMKFKYEERKKAEEDELLKSDNEDDCIEALKATAKTDKNPISMEEEEDLLKSGDEEEEEFSKEHIQNSSREVHSEEWKSNENLIIENKRIENFQIDTHNTERVSNESNANFQNHNEAKIDLLSNETSCLDSHGITQTNDVDKPINRVKDWRQKSDNTIRERCDDAENPPESNIKITSQPKVRKNTENHRILYQFDLDDDSSSQESFQYKRSPVQTNEDKKQRTSDDSPINHPEFYSTVTRHSISETTDVDDVNRDEEKDDEKREIDKEGSENKAKKYTEIPYSYSSKAHSFESDGAVGDNNADIQTSFSSGDKLAKGGEVSGENEVKIEIKSPTSIYFPVSSPKSVDSTSDEDNNYMDQDIDNVRTETKESSSQLSDSLNSTTDNLHNVNENDNCIEAYQKNKYLIDDISPNYNEVNASDNKLQNLNQKENNPLSLEINGDRNSENEYNETEQIENLNYRHFENDEGTKVSKVQEKSLDTNVMLTSPHQHSSFDLPKNEEPRHIPFKNINKSGPQKQEAYIYDDRKTDDEYDNESNLKINENIQQFENDVSNKASFSLSQPSAILHLEEEATQSSMASSASYSTTTSSSQHLVIDHPMEDVKEEKVKPIRITLKRKLSVISDDGDSIGPQRKQVHLHVENEEKITTKSIYNKDHDKPEILSELRPHVQNMIRTEDSGKHFEDCKVNELPPRSVLALESIEEKNPFLLNESHLTPSSFKSLLLQQLEKPLAMPSVTTNRDVLPLTGTPIQLTAPTQQTDPQLLTNSPVVSTQILSIPPPAPSGVTRYLCFKCKTGAFDTLTALTEHQTTCLLSHSLFPFNQTSMQAFHLPATSPTLMNNLKNANTLSATTTSAFAELDKIISSNSPTVPSTKKRYYKCSTCHTFHENWNLFLHIREQHNRHMCLYCVRFFPTAEKLALHLEIKHDLEQNHFNSEEALRNSIPVLESYALESRFLMCCSCQHIFRENEQFSQHDCSEFIKPCTLCGQIGRHTNQCKANPDSKRFSKLKKKKEKYNQISEPLHPPPITNERNQMDSNIPPIGITEHNFNPTIISNSNLNCDSGRAEPIQKSPTFNSMHNEDSNSSSNMVIDESCNVSHIPPVHFQPKETSNTNLSLRIETQKTCAQLEPDLPPDRLAEEQIAPLPPIKLVVPKFKLRVPKEFQKSVDDALSTSESEDDDMDNDQEEEDEHELSDMDKSNAALEMRITKESTMEVAQNSLLAESTPANSQDMEIERNLATESTAEAGNSQGSTVYENTTKEVSSLLLDDEESLDEPNSTLVRIMQEIEQTKLDIQRTKKTSNRHNKQFALPRQPTVSQPSIRTADRNWSPTPPASPNSRWFTPRRLTTSQSGEEQLQKTPQPQLRLLPPPSPLKQLGTTQERRDTIGSDIMDIDETITSQPTQTIICNKLLPLNNENVSNSSGSIVEKSCNDSMDSSQIIRNEISEPDFNNSVTPSKINPASSLLPGRQEDYIKHEHKLKIEDIDPRKNSLETPENINTSLILSADNKINEQRKNETEDDAEVDVCDNKEQEEDVHVTDNEKSSEVEKLPPSDGIEVADEDTVVVDMKLDRSLDKYDVIDFVRICLKTVYPLCLYCNHARRIAVNGKSLVLHMIGHHRFAATVDSITAEELLPATIVAKLKSLLPKLEDHFLNSNSYCTYGDGAFTHHFNERIFECFQCRFVTSTHKELYLHNRKMHLRTAILCFMCRSNFFSFSEILCHICPGVPNKMSVFDVKFRCCLCDLDNIPSPFRLMVHLRKKHFACDVCLEDCRDQSKLSSHVWKHKLHHLCYRCGIAYRNKLDITKHLFWKHGTESTICKRCLQKRWRHVYHFCIPPTTFVCEVCTLCFSKAMFLRVHKRLHSGDLRYPCIEDNCEEKFISRKLLLKHALVHQVLPSEALLETKESQETSVNQEQEFGMNKDVNDGKLKSQTDFQNIKQEVVDIKKEPLDVSEMEDHRMLKEVNSGLVDKKETEEENKEKSSNVKNPKNEESKENKHLGSNATKKKRKKSKRSKELLEDLNLTAPNLSESDSSNDSDSDSDSKTKSEIDVLPRVVLSPPSETENEEKENKSSQLEESQQVLEIWKNFLKTQQGSSTAEELERLKAINEEKKQQKRVPVHVACSDHDYCKIEPEPPTPTPVSEPQIEAPIDDFKKPAAEATSTPETSPTKRKQSKSPRRVSSRRSDASSSSSDSSTSSDSSCSCGSNCSCSSSESNSSSSSSSSEDSDSSLASNNSIRKRHRKKSERDRMRKRSESMSPLKQHKLSVSEIINVDDEDAVKETENISKRSPSPPKEPLYYESDLETNESETDEEFYDEHPQKLASELLARKRAQLIAQTRLSPSHNYDIVENSRPSTPSLPEEATANEKPKVKVKKKKRDRKSSCKGQGFHGSQISASEPAVTSTQTPSNSMVQVGLQQPSSTVSIINSVIDSHHTQSNSLYSLPTAGVLTEQSTLTPRPLTMPPYGNTHRVSEGSSCSDADSSLKRSKRQRRPNKFYGYTSDDENLINGPPLMIGSRAFKPQPPPQLTWRKEDLPTPSKSILNSKNKTPRTPAAFAATVKLSSSKKKSRLSLTGEEKSARKKHSKKKNDKQEHKFPPIPTLKIRPSDIGLNTAINNSFTKSCNYNTTDDTSSDEETSSKSHTSALTNFNSSNVKQTVAAIAPPIVLPSQPPAPPVPQTTAFNHRIPPALLPNPDFATLQYFKANNIRYPIRPPAGARQPREGESVYCYCRCPYDEVSEMIACDGENCLIEWFHFECVGIMVAPLGKWFCAECRPKYSEELYPSAAGQLNNV